MKWVVSLRDCMKVYCNELRGHESNGELTVFTVL